MSTHQRAHGQQFQATSREDWARSDEYHNSFLIQKDSALAAALEKSEAHGLPKISVSTTQGKFLNLLARSIGASRILEVGTLGGYSTIWMAKALPDGGKLITLELSPKHAEVAAENIRNAGLSGKVEIKVGPAAETLKSLEPNPPFDLVFIDADKPGNLTYYLEAKRLTRKGGVIIVDNVVRHGAVASPEPAAAEDKNVQGVRRLLEHLKNDKEVDATTIGIVGEKGYDGILYSIKL